MFLVPLTPTSRPSQQFVRSLDRLFDDSFDRLFSDTPRVDSPRVASLDVTETESSYTAHLDLPGVAKEDVRVSVEGRKVTVQAETKAEAAAPTVADGDKKDATRVLLRERSLPNFVRSFTLPVEVEQADTQAKLENGVLTLSLPKRVQRNASQITIR